MRIVVVPIERFLCTSTSPWNPGNPAIFTKHQHPLIVEPPAPYVLWRCADCGLKVLDCVTILESMLRRVEQGWTKHKFACDSFGVEKMPRETLASSWCLLGALLAETLSQEAVQPLELICVVLRKPRHFSSLVEFNDDPQTGKSEVVGLLEKTLLLAKSEPLHTT